MYTKSLDQIKPTHYKGDRRQALCGLSSLNCQSAMFKKLILTTCFLAILICSFATSKQRVNDIHDQVYNLLDTSLDSALLMSNHALEISQDLGYSWGVGNSHFLLGYIAKFENKLSQAMIHYLRALNALEDLTDKKSINTKVKLLTNCGTILEDHYNYEAALEYYDDALNLAIEHGLKNRIVKALYNRSSANQEQGNYEMATEDIKLCLKLALELRDEYMIVNAWNIFGIIHMESEKYQAAREYYQTIINYDYQDLKPSKYIGRAYHNLARSHYLEGQTELAESYYLKSLDIKEERNKPNELFVTLVDLAELYLMDNHLRAGRAVGLRAHGLYFSVPLQEENYQLFHILSEIQYGLKEYEKAREFSTRYKEQNELFLQEEREIQKQQETFKIDLVMAGFQNEILSNQEISRRDNTILFMGLVILALLIYVKLRWNSIRKSLVKELRPFISNGIKSF